MLSQEPERGLRPREARRGFAAGGGHPRVEEDAMRFGVIGRLAVLASLSLLVSGQLCMLTTCVPRLREAGSAAAHACCTAAPAAESAGTPERVPLGAMPCDQLSSLAEVPTLTPPAAVEAAPACDVGPVPPLAPPLAVGRLERERDTGPRPGVESPAPAGLRAPPIA
jgi:hypothetical protein